MPDLIPVRAVVLKWEAKDILSLELRNLDDSALPAFTAGSHIDLHLPNGMIRSYSLCNNPAETHRYIIGVAKDPKSRGGSQFIHEMMRVGAEFTISAPRNNFALDEETEGHVLIAGGIGVTPMMSMLHRLLSLGKKPKLYYAARERARLAYAIDIDAISDGHVYHIDSEIGAPLDIKSIISDNKGCSFYCCGPAPMLNAFEEATRDLPEEHVHLERFAAVPVHKPEVESGFEVECARSKKVFEIAADQSIGTVLEEAGIDVALSCREGVCGSCETKILSGAPEHRDSVLSKSEKESSKTLMICVSRCRSARLVLDI